MTLLKYRIRTILYRDGLRYWVESSLFGWLWQCEREFRTEDEAKQFVDEARAGKWDPRIQEKVLDY